jgi:hypothetical protein
MSPLLFNVTTADISQGIKALDIKATLYMYADDMVLCSKVQKNVQDAFTTLTWTGRNGLTINKEKTEEVIFRKGGRISTQDKVYLGNYPLQISIQYKYLGITFQTTGTCFSIHVKEKVVNAIKAINEINYLHRLSLKTAKKLFMAKIIPILTYGIELIWEHLKKRDLEQIERVKATFLKRALCVDKTTQNRLVYELGKEPFLIEELRVEKHLPATISYNDSLAERVRKREEIPLEFYGTEAMINHGGRMQNVNNMY